MSFDTISPYFAARMTSVDSTLKEWEDGFNIENIPSSILDKAWHILQGTATYRGTAHNCLHFTCPVTLNVFIKGYRDPKEAIDTGWKLADSIIREVTSPVNRLNQPKIKNVLPGIVGVRALSQDNDNAAVLELQFNCDVVIG